MLFHLVATLAAAVFAKAYGWDPIGPVSDSVNAALGFASWYLPILTALLVGMRVLISHTTLGPLPVILVIVLPLTFAFLGYLSAAFAAAHRIPLVRAVVLVCATGTLCALASEQVSKVAS